MAQVGDTITYTYVDNFNSTGHIEPQSEDISSIDKIKVEYCEGAGGSDEAVSNGGGGGRIDNVTVDVSSKNTLFIFVAGHDTSGRAWRGRYNGGNGLGYGGGSSEISFDSSHPFENDNDADLPFLVGAGGGGSGSTEGGGFADPSGSGGAREGQSAGNGSPGGGFAPPLGGDGSSTSTPGEGGEAAVDDQNRGFIIDSGTSIKGGGPANGGNGEIKITYTTLAPPAPTNVQVIDSATEDELTIDWDTVSNATSYNVYRAQASGSTKGDYTLVAQPTSPPYTDTGLEDGEEYYYRVTSEN